MDPNATVDEMINMISDLDGMRRGPERSALLKELNEKRNDLHRWAKRGGFEPRIGWAVALAL